MGGVPTQCWDRVWEWGGTGHTWDSQARGTCQDRGRFRAEGWASATSCVMTQKTLHCTELPSRL